MLKKILIGSSWIVLLSGVVFLLVFSSFKQNETACAGFDVNINYQGTDHLITPWIVKNQIKNRCGDPVSHSLSDINIENIELQILSIPYVQKADVFLHRRKVGGKNYSAETTNARDQSAWARVLC